MSYSHLRKYIEGGTYADTQLEKMSDDYSTLYNSSLSIFDVIINSDRADIIYHYQVATPYRALVDFNIKNKNSSLNKTLFKKEVRTKHSDGFNVGNIIEIENKTSLEKQTYLLTSGIETKEGYDLNIAEQCNYTLKFQSSDLTIQFIPCVLYNSSSATDGVSSDKVMNLPYGKIGMLIQANDITKEFTRDKRFLIKDEAWIIEFVGKLQDGLLDIVLTENQIDLTKDNIELGIADYIEPTSTPTNPTTGFYAEITGDDSIVNSQTKTYTIKWYQDGVEISDTIASVIMSDETLVTSTFTGNTITVTADRTNKGIVTMTVTSTTNGIIGTKDIEIKGLW